MKYKEEIAALNAIYDKLKDESATVEDKIKRSRSIKMLNYLHYERASLGDARSYIRLTIQALEGYETKRTNRETSGDSKVHS